MFPYAGMPWPAQWLAEIFPMTHFMRLIRGILLRAATLADLWPELAALGVFIVVMLGVAAYSGLVVLRRIDAIQREVGQLPSQLPAGDARRTEFDALHLLSTRLMMLNMAGALVLLYWEARET